MYLFERESFRTLNFNWETFIHGRKGLFPLTFNCNSPWYWNSLTLVSRIKNTNMRSGEMFAYQQFSQCLIPRPCWSWTMNIICLMKENKNQSCYWWNELNIHISYNICILKAVFYIEYYYAFHIFSPSLYTFVSLQYGICHGYLCILTASQKRYQLSYASSWTFFL